MAKRLDVRPEEMLFAGNEAKDVLGANRAGLASALLDRAGTGLACGQRFSLSSLAELDELFGPKDKKMLRPRNPLGEPTHAT